MQDFSQASAYITALTGDINTVCDFRAIFDSAQDRAAIPMRGTLQQVWDTLCEYQSRGYGIFVTINQLGNNYKEDGKLSHELDNLQNIRAHVIDLDNEHAPQNYDRAIHFQIAPSFAVETSPNKYHVYWPVAPYQGNDRYQLVQRKLRQLFDGDKSVIDATRVLRLPGTLHLKDPNNPHLVKVWSLNGFGVVNNVESMELATANVNIIDSGVGVRKELGDPDMAAPTLDWLKHGMDMCDPNDLERYEWIGMMAAFKQAGWTLTDEQELFGIFSKWCEQYEHNDLAENQKHWNSLRNTELGWKSMVSRIPALKAQTMFGDAKQTVTPNVTGDVSPMPVQEPPELDCKGEFLTHLECQQWFRGCVYIASEKKILTPKARRFEQGQFKAMYGGKQFIITGADAKKTDDAWKAALQSTLWTIPKVDHMRFIPSKAFGELIEDDLERQGVNVYKPIKLIRIQGDAMPYVNHVAKLLPDPQDQAKFHTYMAHNIQKPGVKIPWAFVLQSTPGAGKGVFKYIMKHCMGRSYTHYPNAKELAESGSKFNAWMRGKLFILADEIKVDDRRDMIEVLKPMISEEEIEIQAKGYDQVIEDNYANWGFFTNFKDAIPVDQNDRRFMIFFCQPQSAVDLMELQMGKVYFTWLYDWLKADGAAIVADWYMNYQLPVDGIDMRAPDTSSTAELIRISRSPIENIICDCLADGKKGFRNNWLSSIAVQNAIKDAGRKSVMPQTIKSVCEGMGYHEIGRAHRGYMQESPINPTTRSILYHKQRNADLALYGRGQGYE